MTPIEKTTTAPALVKRPADERGTTELGWLHSRHTFSFGNYSTMSPENSDPKPAEQQL